MCVLSLQLPAEAVPQDQRGLFYPRTSPETILQDSPVSTLYLYLESLVSSSMNAHRRLHRYLV